MRTEIDAAAAHARRAGARVGARRRLRQPRQARRRSGSHGPASASTAPGRPPPVADRWKTQLNENAKVPAFAAELPEADHNEIVGWEGAAVARAASSAVFLEDADQHPRVRQRIELTARADRAASAAGTLRLESRGDEPARAAAVARAAGRPGVGLPRGAARHRPHAGRGDRAAEGGAGARPGSRVACGRRRILRAAAPAPPRAPFCAHASNSDRESR